MTAASNDISIKVPSTERVGTAQTMGYEDLKSRTGKGMHQGPSGGVQTFQSSWQSIISSLENVDEVTSQSGEASDLSTKVSPNLPSTAPELPEASSILRSTQSPTVLTNEKVNGALDVNSDKTILSKNQGLLRFEHHVASGLGETCSNMHRSCSDDGEWGTESRISSKEAGDKSGKNQSNKEKNDDLTTSMVPALAAPLQSVNPYMVDSANDVEPANGDLVSSQPNCQQVEGERTSSNQVSITVRNRTLFTGQITGADPVRSESSTAASMRHTHRLPTSPSLDSPHESSSSGSTEQTATEPLHSTIENQSKGAHARNASFDASPPRAPSKDQTVPTSAVSATPIANRVLNASEGKGATSDSAKKAANIRQNDLRESATPYRNEFEIRKRPEDALRIQPGKRIASGSQEFVPNQAFEPLVVRGPERQVEGNVHGTTSAELGNPVPKSGETFAALDSLDARVAQAWVHSSTRLAEAGFQDPGLGWVGVRAHVDSTAVHATLLPGSNDAAQSLGSHLAGLNAYLADHHSQIEKVVIAPPDNTGVEPGSDQRMNQRHGEEAGKDPRSEGGSGSQGSHPSKSSGDLPKHSADVLAANGRLTSSFPYSTSGDRHISVMA